MEATKEHLDALAHAIEFLKVYEPIAKATSDEMAEVAPIAAAYLLALSSSLRIAIPAAEMAFKWMSAQVNPEEVN